MHDQNLIKTKLLIPRSSSGVIPRKELFERLDAAPRKRLTLVSAPAGYGKTTLVAGWITQHEYPAAWVSLDERDRSLFGILRYLCLALTPYLPNEMEMLNARITAEKDMAVGEILGGLINALTDLDHDLMLVLDDYHCVETPEVHEFLRQLIQDSPPNFHVLLTTRSDPPLSLAKLRAKDELLEIRSNHLAFNLAEFTSFMIQQSQGRLSQQQCEALFRKTEGWITGARLALLSLSRNADGLLPLDSQDGPDRHIMDYLMEEVLDQLDADTKSFLMNTSILSQLHDGLCDQVTGRNDSEELLKTLERENLFIFSLDSQQNWYRYHPLVAQIFQHRIRKQAPHLLTELHQRASGWYQQQGMISEAIYHASQAEHSKVIVALIKKHGSRMLQSARLVELFEWYQYLPEATIKADPELCINLAWTHLLMGELSAAKTYSDCVSELVSGPEAHENLKGSSAALQAYLDLFNGDPLTAIDSANKALSIFKSENHDGISVAAFILGNALNMVGHHHEAIAAYEKAALSAKSIENIHIELPARNAIASSFRVLGELHEAEARFTENVNTYSGDGLTPFPLGTSYIGLGEIHLDRHEIAPALRFMEQGLKIAELWGNSDARIHGYLALTQLHLAQDRFNLAGASLKALNSLLDIRGNQYHRMNQVHATRIEYLLRTQKIDQAKAYLSQQGLQLRQPFSWPRIRDYITILKVMLMRGELLAGLENCQGILSKFGTRIIFRDLLELRIIQAILFHTLDQEDASRESFVAAVEMAAPQFLTKPFTDYADFLEPLISSIKGSEPGHLQAFMSRIRLEISSTALLITEKGTVEKLSDRELEVLTLLAEGLTNDQISKRLFVSLSTIKTHLLHIYAKLEVKNRTSAIEKGRKLGLIESA